MGPTAPNTENPTGVTAAPIPGVGQPSTEAPKTPFTITGTVESVVPPVANAASSTPTEVLGSTMSANLGPDVAAAAPPATVGAPAESSPVTTTEVPAPVQAVPSTSPDASIASAPTPTEGQDMPIPGETPPPPPNGIGNLNVSAPDAAYQAVGGQTVDAASAQPSAEPTPAPDPLAVSHDAGIVTLGTETAPISTNSAPQFPTPIPAPTENPFGGSSTTLGPDVAGTSTSQAVEEAQPTSGDPARDKMMQELAAALGAEVAPIEDVITRGEEGLNKLSPDSPLREEYKEGFKGAVMFSLSHKNKPN
jgi:hypothetical protein